MPRPHVRGTVIDFHTHLLAARHAKTWFEAADHFGIDKFLTMSPLEEALVLQREWPGRLHFIAIPKWADMSYDDWMCRIEGFYNIGVRLLKFHMAPGTMQARKYRLDMPEIRKIIDDAVARKMIIMSHVGDPDTWYAGKYIDAEKFGTRAEHYRIWEETLEYIPRSIVGWGASGRQSRKLAEVAVASRSFPEFKFRLQRNALDGAGNFESSRCRPRIFHPQPGPHSFRLGSGQRRRSQFRFFRQPILVA